MFFKRLKDLLGVIILIIITSSALFTYTKFEGYKTTEVILTNQQDTLKDNLNIYMEGVIKESVDKLSLLTDYRTELIHQDILSKYGNNFDLLKHDIDYPSDNSLLSKILDSHLKDVWINKDNNSNKVFVISDNNIIWNKSLPIISDSYESYITVDELINYIFNSNLGQISLDSIRDGNITKNKIIFWEAIQSNDNNHNIIDNMDIKELLNIYSNEGIEGLKSYEILVTGYITKNGDIFGEDDVDSLGHKIDNSKIMIIQRVNLYDILYNHIGEINKLQQQIDDLDIIMENNDNKIIKYLMILLSVTIFILIIAMYIERKCDNNIEKKKV